MVDHWICLGWLPLPLFLHLFFSGSILHPVSGFVMKSVLWSARDMESSTIL